MNLGQAHAPCSLASLGKGEIEAGSQKTEFPQTALSLVHNDYPGFLACLYGIHSGFLNKGIYICVYSHSYVGYPVSIVNITESSITREPGLGVGICIGHAHCGWL